MAHEGASTCHVGSILSVFLHVGGLSPEQFLLETPLRDMLFGGGRVLCGLPLAGILAGLLPEAGFRVPRLAPNIWKIGVSAPSRGEGWAGFCAFLWRKQVIYSPRAHSPSLLKGGAS